MLHRISVTKYNDLSKQQKSLHKYPNAQEVVKKLLIEIIKRTLSYKVTHPLIKYIYMYINVHVHVCRMKVGVSLVII